ncbi:hypothetical protein BPIT_11390 [Candidatus Brocadia pituitae]|nr:hypothetical protein BPIT_11390 [Candidatus Brocadia pituitae]
MPYKVEIANTKSNTEFLQKLPKEIIPEFVKCLNIVTKINIVSLAEIIGLEVN